MRQKSSRSSGCSGQLRMLPASFYKPLIKIPRYFTCNLSQLCPLIWEVVGCFDVHVGDKTDCRTLRMISSLLRIRKQSTRRSLIADIISQRRLKRRPNRNKWHCGEYPNSSFLCRKLNLIYSLGMIVMKSEVESDNCRSPGLLREADRCLYQKLIRIEICHFSFFPTTLFCN